MNRTTIVTNATNGEIVRITTYYHSHLGTGQAVMLAILAAVLLGVGLHLLLRKDKPGQRKRQ
jgi:hypothetical protein